MKKFRKRLVSVALSTGIALGGIATCNLCTKTSCSAITSEEIAQLVKEDVGVAQLIEEIRKQDFYKDFVKGESKSLLIVKVQVQRDKLSKEVSNVQKALATVKKAKADAKKVIDNFKKAISDADKAEDDAKKAIANMKKVIVQYQQSSFCRNTITPLISFIENYNISEQHKDKFLNHLVGQLDFMIYLLETDPDLN